MTPSALTRDPRHFQIATLTGLLAWGVLGLGHEVRPEMLAATLAAALGTQWLGTRWAHLPRFDPRSPLISALSLALLLRTPSAAVAAGAAALAVGSKFVLRAPAPGGGSRHVFNPSNFAIVVTLLLTDRAWVSPGRWGSAALAALAVAGIGALVVRRARRGDVTWAFLAAWTTLLAGRAAWLGDPVAIPLHQLADGGLLIFAFFMISDPKTTPDSRAGRILYAALVALGGGFVEFHLFRPNGLLWSLAAAAPLVPWIDRLLPAERRAAPRRPASPPALPHPSLLTERSR